MRTLLTRISGFALGLAALNVACADPTKPDFTGVEVEGEEICEASRDWLPNTPELPQFLPVPHPAGECPFYRSGWQNFLVAMQPTNADGLPAMMGYPTIDKVFQHKKPHPANRAALGDIKQAGGRQILIDQNGNSLYYGIHVNQAFSDFIKKYGLDTSEGLRAYPTNPATKNLIFPPGVVEFKSAWQVVEGATQADIDAQTKNFIWMKTTVPTLSQDPVTFAVKEDRDTPRPVTVRLLAVHVVSTLVGHPEFVWASFEHTTSPETNMTDTGSKDGQRDVAPILPNDKNPADDDPFNLKVTMPASDTDHILYKAGTPANQANKSKDETDLRLVGQKFFLPDMTTPAQTSIYRMFPASKSNTIDADAAITSLNHNVEVLFNDPATNVAANDRRGHYRLLGAQWMDKPGYFAKNVPLQNNDSSPMLAPGKHIAQDGSPADPVPLDTLLQSIRDEGSDSEFSILAGEDRMSSTAMESFTQDPNSFNNCFTCHNTQAITVNGIPTDRDGKGMQLLGPGLLNVSHILSQFLLEEFEDGSLTP